ncbi:MAG: hypothetical protein JSU01_20945 [Bacteroidetes bacterium]|nr:hypothetical protein [Bacteroidota bacterium]
MKKLKLIGVAIITVVIATSVLLASSVKSAAQQHHRPDQVADIVLIHPTDDMQLVNQDLDEYNRRGYQLVSTCIFPFQANFKMIMVFTRK